MPITYDAPVLQTVAGSSAGNTHSAYVTSVVEELAALLHRLKTPDPSTNLYPTYTLDRNDPLVSVLVNVTVKLKTVAYVADSAINALGIYAVPGFYTDVLTPTRASEDGGKLAANTLRQIVPGLT